MLFFFFLISRLYDRELSSNIHIIFMDLKECHINLRQLVSCHTKAFHHSWSRFRFPPDSVSSQNKLNKNCLDLLLQAS